MSHDTPTLGHGGIAMMGIGYLAMAATSIVVLSNEDGEGKAPSVEIGPGSVRARWSF